MSVVEYIKKVLLSCPYINVSSLDMHIDSTDSKRQNYSIDGEPVTTVITSYLDGSAMKQYTFSLIVRKSTFDDEDRMENTKTYENVAAWFESISKKRALPSLGNAYQPMKMEALGGVYLMERTDDNETGLYAMQCRFTYFEKARNF